MATTANTATALKTLSVEAEPSATYRSRPVAGGEATDNVVSLDAYLRELMPVDLSELAQDIVAQMLTEGRLEKVDIQYHLPNETVRVDVPRRQFAQVVEHMVATAAEAMKVLTDRTHMLRVIVEPADAFGDYGPRLRVQDTGASVIVEDAMQDAIESAEALGVKLAVKNRPAGGNIFVVELPPEPMASW
jgi:signal transduction histidine kinase